MANNGSVQDIIAQMDLERNELYKKYGYTNGSKVVKAEKPKRTPKVEKPVKKEEKPIKPTTTKTEVKKKEEPVKVVKSKKVEKPIKPEVKKEEKPIKVKKARKVVKKAEKKKTTKPRKNLKVFKKAMPVFIALAAGGAFIIASGVIQNSIDKYREKQYLNAQKTLSAEESLRNSTGYVNYNYQEEPELQPVVIEDDTEYISGEFIDNGYKFNESLTPEYLKGINPTLSSTTAWIEIPGTKIDYPFVLPSTANIDKVEGLRDSVNRSEYNETDYMNMYFLKHTINDAKSDWGTLYQDIYTQPLNQHSDKLSDMSVIYGHHMQDGSMFTGLDKWKKDKDGTYGAEHPYGVIYTDDGLCYKLTFITSRVVSGNDSSNIHSGDFKSVEDKQAFIDEAIAQAKRDGNFTLDGYTVDEDTKFMSLVTCSYRQQNDRYVLIGVLEKAAIKDITIDGYEIGKKKER